MQKIIQYINGILLNSYFLGLVFFLHINNSYAEAIVCDAYVGNSASDFITMFPQNINKKITPRFLFYGDITLENFFYIRFSNFINTFNRLCVSSLPKTKLNSNIGQALFNHMLLLLRNNGELIVTEYLGKQFIPHLDKYKQCVQISSNNSYTIFIKKCNISQSSSLIDFMTDIDKTELVLTYLITRNSDLTGVQKNKFNFDINKEPKKNIYKHKKEISKQLSSLSRTHKFNDEINHLSYMNGNAIIKIPYLREIINIYLSGKPSSLIDFGGGYGLISVGLSLEFPTIKYLEIVDLCVIYKPIFNELTQYYKLNNKSVFTLSKMEEYKFNKKYDLIMFLGSLLLADKNKLNDILENAWGALNPGGIIVVHEQTVETLKDITDLKGVDKKRFIRSDLDTLLSRFTIPKYYASDSYNEKSVDNKTLSKFWIIQKAKFLNEKSVDNKTLSKSWIIQKAKFLNELKMQQVKRW